MSNDQNYALWLLSGKPDTDPQQIISLLRAGATPFYFEPLCEAAADPAYRPYEESTVAQLLLLHGPHTGQYLDAILLSHDGVQVLTCLKLVAYRLTVPGSLLEAILGRCSHNHARAARMVQEIGRQEPVPLMFPVLRAA